MSPPCCKDHCRHYRIKMSFVNYNERVFKEAGDVPLLRKRSDARMKTYESVLDARAWCNNEDDQRQYILDLMKLSSQKMKILPLDLIIEALLNEKIQTISMLMEKIRILEEFIAGLNLPPGKMQALSSQLSTVASAATAGTAASAAASGVSAGGVGSASGSAGLGAITTESSAEKSIVGSGDGKCDSFGGVSSTLPSMSSPSSSTPASSANVGQWNKSCMAMSNPRSEMGPAGDFAAVAVLAVKKLETIDCIIKEGALKSAMSRTKADISDDSPDGLNARLDQLRCLEDAVRALKQKAASCDEVSEQLDRQRSSCRCKELKKSSDDLCNLRAQMHEKDLELEMLRCQLREMEMLRMERNCLKTQLEEMKRLQGNTAELQRRCECVNQLKKRNDELQAQCKCMKQKLENMEKVEHERDTLSEQVCQCESHIQDQKQEIKKLRDEVDCLCTGRDQQQDRITTTMVTMRAKLEKKNSIIAKSEQELATVQDRLRCSIEDVACENTCLRQYIEELERNLCQMHTELVQSRQKLAQRGATAADGGDGGDAGEMTAERDQSKKILKISRCAVERVTEILQKYLATTRTGAAAATAAGAGAPASATLTGDARPDGDRTISGSRAGSCICGEEQPTSTTELEDHLMRQLTQSQQEIAELREELELKEQEYNEQTDNLSRRLNGSLDQIQTMRNENQTLRQLNQEIQETASQKLARLEKRVDSERRSSMELTDALQAQNEENARLEAEREQFRRKSEQLFVELQHTKYGMETDKETLLAEIEKLRGIIGDERKKCEEQLKLYKVATSDIEDDAMQRALDAGAPARKLDAQARSSQTQVTSLRKKSLSSSDGRKAGSTTAQVLETLEEQVESLASKGEAAASVLGSVDGSGVVDNLKNKLDECEQKLKAAQEGQLCQFLEDENARLKDEMVKLKNELADCRGYGDLDQTPDRDTTAPTPPMLIVDTDDIGVLQDTIKKLQQQMQQQKRDCDQQLERLRNNLNASLLSTPQVGVDGFTPVTGGSTQSPLAPGVEAKVAAGSDPNRISESGGVPQTTLPVATDTPYTTELSVSGGTAPPPPPTTQTTPTVTAKSEAAGIQSQVAAQSPTNISKQQTIDGTTLLSDVSGGATAVYDNLAPEMMDDNDISTLQRFDSKTRKSRSKSAEKQTSGGGGAASTVSVKQGTATAIAGGSKGGLSSRQASSLDRKGGGAGGSSSTKPSTVTGSGGPSLVPSSAIVGKSTTSSSCKKAGICVCGQLATLISKKRAVEFECDCGKQIQQTSSEDVAKQQTMLTKIKCVEEKLKVQQHQFGAKVKQLKQLLERFKRDLQKERDRNEYLVGLYNEQNETVTNMMVKMEIMNAENVECKKKLLNTLSKTQHLVKAGGSQTTPRTRSGHRGESSCPCCSATPHQKESTKTIYTMGK